MERYTIDLLFTLYYSAYVCRPFQNVLNLKNSELSEGDTAILRSRGFL